MSEKGIDAYRVLAVLGYCLLPMVGVGALSVMVTLECVLVYSCYLWNFRLQHTWLAEWLVTFYLACLFFGARTPHQGYS